MFILFFSSELQIDDVMDEWSADHVYCLAV